MIFRDKINKVDAWMSYRQLPGKLRSDITGYYANSYVVHSLYGPFLNSSSHKIYSATALTFCHSGVCITGEGQC